MYAIIRQGGRQYRVSEGDQIVCEKVNASQGEVVRFDKVLLVGEGDKTIVAADDLAKYDIKAELVENFSEDKIVVFKYKAKKGYRQKNGHRQQKSRIKVVSIGTGKTAATKAKAAEAKDKPAPAKVEASPAAKKTTKTTTKTTTA